MRKERVKLGGMVRVVIDRAVRNIHRAAERRDVDRTLSGAEVAERSVG